MARTTPFSAEGGSAFGGHGTSMYYLYILKSIRDNWHYIGTTANINNRFAEHNAGEVRSTKAHRPLFLIHTEEFINKTIVRKREVHLKRNAKARRELFNQINAPIV